MLCNLFATRHCVKQLPRAILWVGGHEPNAKIARNRIDLPQQLRERDRRFQILPIRVDILPEERNVTVARFHQGTCFSEHRLYRAAAFTPADIRDDTVAAKVVAAVHHGKKRLKRAVPHDGKPLGDIARLIRQLKHAALAAQGTI